MNDVRSLLAEAVPQDLRTTDHWPDADSDVARGRALLVRRRRRFVLAGGTAAGALALAGVLVPTGHAPGRAPAASSVALVAYEGTQPKGYTLKTIPKGWEVATADNTALVLHRIGTPKSGDFQDKILVEGDLNAFPRSGDQAVAVNGHKGWFFGHRDADHSVTLIFQTDERRQVDVTPGKANPRHPRLASTSLNIMVQLPHSLNWDVTTTVRFASGITMAPGAGGAVG
ncbi:hypothetical protein [Actinomadura sp. DC4]|uniref:hypothetical protein n=1 Tax=Actinomadura sp. DC4 TaxID=3055069 RepID=UPI0025AFC9CE|nr:hypothetical protein [Actinomadura sp. DC4]MDN3357703.1 hypothetical protein [Actinomadura sp. DC4]